MDFTAGHTVIERDDIEFGSLTDVGVKRSHNQDSLSLLPASDADQFRDRGHVFLVADGMGAHAVGELASKLAADTIPHVYTKHARDGVAAAIVRAFVEANQTIHSRGEQNREFKGMGTTGTALVLRPDGVWVGHVGDSRAYRIRRGMVEQLSFDHSLLWELAKRQGRDPDELQGVPSNVIVRSLGPEPIVKPDVEGPHPILPGDVFVLCSDGLSGPVHDREIGAVATALPPDEACRFLIQLANLQGGPDNITAIVVKVRGDAPPSTDVASVAPFWTGPGLGARAVRWAKALPLAIFALGLGIALAMLAIFLSYQESGGELVSFVLAGLFLVGGLVALMAQSFRDRSAPVARTAPTQSVYRTIPCSIEPGLVDRLVNAIGTLKKRAADGGIPYDNGLFDSLYAKGEAARSKQDALTAFREHCRAMLILMEASQAQRNKGEAFRPIWDKSPDA